jgi:hypothetical protein
VPLIDTLSIDKSKLYIKKLSGEVETYELLGEFLSTSLSAESTTIYIMDYSKPINKDTDSPSHETYYKVKWNGELDTTIEYLRPI